jgi:hypothetical protein
VTGRWYRKTSYTTVAQAEGVEDYGRAWQDVLRRRHRRRLAITALVVAMVLAVTGVSMVVVKQPDLEVTSATVQSISLPTHTLYLNVRVSVHNPNRLTAHLLSVEGDILSGTDAIGDFYSDEGADIAPYSNFTVDLDVRVNNVPLPLPDPDLVVAGKARLRVWIVGITYHFEHAIPLTQSTDRVNRPPVAAIDSQPVVRRAADAEFDGSRSYDPDGRVVGWSWDFGDGYAAEGEVVQHAYRRPGTYDVVLTVVDLMGATDSATATIRVLVL